MSERSARALTLLFYLLVFVALLALAQRGLNNYYQRILAIIGIHIMLTVSLSLTNGYTGDFSLGIAGFMAIGAYTAALLTLPVTTKATLISGLPLWLKQMTLPFPAATVIGGILAAAAAVIVGVPVLRLRGHYLSVATLGLMVIVRVVANNWQTVTRGAKGINGLPAFTNIWWAYGWALLTIYVVWRLVHSPFGRAMMAVREDELAAAARGVRVFRTRLLAFVVSAFFAGAAGSLWAHQVTAITPSSFSFLITFNVIVMLIVGGTSSVPGAVTGAVLMTLVPEALRRLETALAVGGTPLYGLSQIVVAVAVTLIMIFRPQGLLGGVAVRLPTFIRPRPAPVGDQ